MKQEKLSFLADNPFYTKRFAFYIGKRCSTSTIKDVAKEFHLDRRAVKELEKQYMREKLRRIGNPGPKIIGIDEISIRKGHTYRIVVSDLERQRPIWFGGEDRSKESLNRFFDELELVLRHPFFLRTIFFIAACSMLHIAARADAQRLTLSP